MNKLFLLWLTFLFSSLSSLALTEGAKVTEDKLPAKSKSDSQIITIETATIRGNQELPTVLYLVPWQPPEINSLDATQTADITKNDIELIDRNSFKRLIEYHESFKAR
jgi:hypothetical protein